jgi:hypothetical protein
MDCEPFRLNRNRADEQEEARSRNMLGTLLVVILLLVLVGSLPRWGHSRNWGYMPSGGIGLVVLVVIVLLVLGRI